MDDQYVIVDDDEHPDIRNDLDSGEFQNDQNREEYEVQRELEKLLSEMEEMEEDPAFKYWLDARQDELGEEWNRRVWNDSNDK